MLLQPRKLLLPVPDGALLSPIFLKRPLDFPGSLFYNKKVIN